MDTEFRVFGEEALRAALKGMTRQQKMDKAVEGYRLVVEAAQEYGIPIGFENTPHDLKPLASMQDCEYLLEHVPGLEFVFDTVNSRVADTCCNELEIYERLKKYIGRIHLKDVVIGEFASGEQCTDGKKIRCVPSGSGVIPIKELPHRMQEDGYEGMLTVEYAALAEIKLTGTVCRYFGKSVVYNISRKFIFGISGCSKLFFNAAEGFSYFTDFSGITEKQVIQFFRIGTDISRCQLACHTLSYIKVFPIIALLDFRSSIVRH